MNMDDESLYTICVIHGNDICDNNFWYDRLRYLYDIEHLPFDNNMSYFHIYQSLRKYQAHNDILLIAIKIGSLPIIKALIDRGDTITDNAFISSIEQGNFNIIKYLVDNGANVHARNETPLKIAMRNDNINIIKYLLKNGADITILSDEILRTISRTK